MTTLDPNDLNFENHRNFDGTTVYAQNKVCTVVETWRRGGTALCKLFPKLMNSVAHCFFLSPYSYFISRSIYIHKYKILQLSSVICSCCKRVHVSCIVKICTYRGSSAPFYFLQRQQVVITRKWAEKYPNIHFSSMHPGWADTPGMYLIL